MTSRPKNPKKSPDGDVATLVRPKIKRPSQYQVVMLNDDYTPMNFVVYLLISQFKHSTEQAVETMLQIHHQGRAICGVYPFEIAETKAAQTMALARAEQYPLRCTLEKKP